MASAENVHNLQVTGTAIDRRFVVTWLDDPSGPPPDLAVTLLRPNGTPVNPGVDVDVAQNGVEDDGLLDMLFDDFVIDIDGVEDEGIWQVKVFGAANIPAGGLLYWVGLLPESVVALEVGVDEPSIDEGGSIIVTARVSDSGTPTPTPFETMTANVIPPAGTPTAALIMTDAGPPRGRQGSGGRDLHRPVLSRRRFLRPLWRARRGGSL